MLIKVKTIQEPERESHFAMAIGNLASVPAIEKRLVSQTRMQPCDNNSQYKM